MRFRIFDLRFQIIVTGLILCIGAGTAYAEYNAATGTDDLILVSTETEISMGRSYARQLQDEPEMPLSHNTDDLKRVNDIGNRLVPVIDRKELTYFFSVINKDEMNAFALPGGYVYIFKGLLDKLDDGQLAFVLAHEIGHITARHSIKRMQGSLAANALMIGSVFAQQQSANRNGNISGVQASSVVLSTIMSGYSQEDELMADTLAAKYVKAIGISPQKGVEVMELLQKEDKKNIRGVSYFRSHPFTGARIKNIKQKACLPMSFKDMING
jgi:predicted Zn-dependent protease